MVSTFQGWRFQRWRQVSLWTAKKIRRQRIRGIIRRRSESNPRGACRIIGGNSTSRFCTIESHGNETRKLGALWTERRWKAIFHLRTADSKTQRKGFLHRIMTEDEKWIFYDNSKKKNTTLSPINHCHRPQHQHMAELSWFEDHVLYLMGPKGSCLL